MQNSNSSQCKYHYIFTYYEIGRMIVEDEQKGKYES